MILSVWHIHIVSITANIACYQAYRAVAAMIQTHTRTDENTDLAIDALNAAIDGNGKFFAQGYLHKRHNCWKNT